MAKFSEAETEVLKENALKLLVRVGDESLNKKANNSKARLIEEQLAKILFYNNNSEGPALAEIFSLITGEEIHYRGSGNASLAPPEGSIIVPLTNTNSHNYAIGQPAMYLGNRGAYGTTTALKMNGIIGNNLPIGATGGPHWRYATAVEIEGYFDALKPTPKGEKVVVKDLIKSIS